jgi:pimeloyl-ACP methyl ester carboxylesterase
MPGFGKKETPLKPYSLDDYVDFIDKFLKANKISKTIIIGHSFGGRVAIKYASLLPQKVEKLILTGVPGFLPVSNLKVKFFLLLSKLGGLIFRLPILSSTQDLAQKILYRISGANDYARVEGIMRKTFKLIIREDLVKSMENLRVPVALVWGERDTIVPVSIAYRMNKVISGSKLTIIKNTTHKLPYENYREFYQAIKIFLI